MAIHCRQHQLGDQKKVMQMMLNAEADIKAEGANYISLHLMLRRS